MSTFALVDKTTFLVHNVVLADNKEVVEEFNPSHIVVNLDSNPEVGIDWAYDKETQTFSRE